MTDPCVQFVLAKLDAFLKRELQLPKKVDTGIRTLGSELDSIAAFLSAAHQRAVQDQQILNWVRKVQDAAYDIIDILDLFDHHKAENGRAISVTRRRAYRSIADQINDIKSILEEINKGRERYPPANSSQAALPPSPTTNRDYSDLHPRFAPLFLSDADVVGFEEDKDMLMAWALDMVDEHKVMFVVGMGGSGKTTLAKQVFDAVKQDFCCSAWISVSKSKKNLEILRNMLDQLCRCSSRAETAPTLLQQSLDFYINRIKEYLLDKRYVIVLDDLWVDDVWRSIMLALPRRNRSRIIITTRRGDIAYSLKDGSVDVHPIQHLSLEKAKELIHRIAFPGSRICPPALATLSNEILGKCEGLPLAITEIGHLLSTKGEREPEWKKLRDSLASELTSHGRLANIAKVLILSYDDLPYHLKNCFLLMNTFPPNHPIQRTKLIRLWIAEDFITEGNNGKELEDLGEEYLNELIQRNLVQVWQMDIDGRPRTCHVQNIMHEIVLSQLQDEKFCEVYPEQRTFAVSNERIRRISIHKGDLGQLCPNLRARALLIFDSLDPYQHSIPIGYSSLKMLRELHLEGANLDMFPADIEELLLLRYLCLRNTGIRSIPKSIGKLKHLETLDLKQTLVRTLPKEICHLSKLRYLLVYRYDIEHYVAFNTIKGFEVAGEITWSANLRKLLFVQVNKNHKIIVAMRGLRELRRLGIMGLRKEDGRILSETIQMLPNLHSLNVAAENEAEVLDMQEISHPPRLQRLYLNGRLERMPSWISKLHDLVRLRLKWSRLDQQSNNPINSLQDLPNLLELQLLDAYNGEQLDFNAGKFQKLKILELELLPQLKMVIMERNSLPCLQKLIIRRCGQLRHIPVGIDDLSQLKEIHLYDMPRNFVSMLEKNGGSLYQLVHHVPLIRSYDAQNGGRWDVKDLSD
ncbi:disease resistance protein RPM1 [Coffea arabica]|uniref:Disease resistance protein RPM1 n=1 Tax=Coffea arabica TaxID=13443 RepID=A0ABM4VQU4_COFAR